jgi:cobalt-zinc-cadmium efflux system protein
MDPSSNGGNGHVHREARGSVRGKFLISIFLNIGITLAELIGGILANSLALISDALHNFSDVLALLMSYFAERVKDKPSTPRMTFGYRRVETLVALINAVSLGAIALFILVEALERWKNPQPVEWKQVFVIGVIALAGNVISVLILHPHKDRNLNVKSAFLHLFYDAISAVGVMASALIIAWTGWVPMDLVISVGISVLIVAGSLDLFKKIYHVLMEAAPGDVDVSEISAFIRSQMDVKEVHHIHLWSLSSDRMALSAHLIIEPGRIQDLDLILGRVTRALRERYSVDHVTLQPELDRCADLESVAG